MEIAGIVGKANVGKSTFFSALTMVNVAVGNFPFTTTRPNRGVTYLRHPCVCKELGVRCQPANSLCIDGVRLIPIQVIDCPGIVEGAHAGRGLGLRFLDEIRQADALIVVVDASGGTDVNGNPVEPGSHDPVEDVRLVEREMDMWMLSILDKEWARIVRTVEAKRSRLSYEVARQLSGLGVCEEHVEVATRDLGLDEAKPKDWSGGDKLRFIDKLRRLAKPMIVAANKSDVPSAAKGIRNLIEAGYDVVPCSAEAERTLRLAAEKGMVKYTPGDSGFTVVDSSGLTAAQRAALDKIAEFMARNCGTGVQRVIDKAYFELLGYIPVFPVEDPNRFTDGKGRILPDVYLIKRGSTPRDLAYKIHSELGESFIYSVDAKSKLRLPSDYRLQPLDVVSIVAARKKS